MKNWNYILLGIGALQSCQLQKDAKTNKEKPNIIMIYSDDVGYGDLGVYGGKIPTPHIDFLANNGIKHLRAYATAATSTPSRFSLLTGEYAWRKKGRGVVSGDAAALIPKGRQTVASVMQKAGYKTAVVGKWHLGLGDENGPNWNGTITNSPLDIGFDYSYLMPSTADRVPTVLMENRKIINLDPNDPIQVSYNKKIGDWPTGKENPALLKIKPSHGHDMTITNGISRIGYQYGGKSALFKDEDLADQFIENSINFIEKNKSEPFFLMVNTNDIHVPRMPHKRFQGKSGYGLRGDAILSLDATVGSITQYLKEENLLENTIIIFSSDNGPVLDDGYQDRSVELVGNHDPFKDLSGGKYSAYEAGTRVPFIIYWQGHIKPQVSINIISQVDFIANLSQLTGVEYDTIQAPDAKINWQSWVSEDHKGREYAIQESFGRNLSVVTKDYKYISPIDNPKDVAWATGIKLGQSKQDQLYDLNNDMREMQNIAKENPKKTLELKQILEKEKKIKPYNF